MNLILEAINDASRPTCGLSAELEQSSSIVFKVLPEVAQVGNDD